MDLNEAKRRLSDSGRTANEPAAKLLAFRINGQLPSGDPLWSTALAPNGALAEAGQVAEWCERFGDGVVSTYCTPLNGGVYVGAIVQ